MDPRHPALPEHWAELVPVIEDLGGLHGNGLPRRLPSYAQPAPPPVPPPPPPPPPEKPPLEKPLEELAEPNPPLVEPPVALAIEASTRPGVAAWTVRNAAIPACQA